MPSRDLLVAAHQQITREWWANRRFGFDLYVSELVLRECRAGDAVLAATRAEVIRELPLLRITNEALELADALVLEGPIPRRAAADALHLSIATVYGCEYLLTWNCKHLANAEIQRPARILASSKGWDLPLVCTPEELMGTEI
jgi:predicted nucleic acid-binding protein